MPALNWDAFATLPGSAEKNFELLCRGVVRQNFGSYGVLRALANQPGVEFHLKVERRCDALGDPGRWWGWQCKWYELPASGELGSSRRTKIEEGIRRTEAHVPGVTDWVLWTRRTLTSADQKWLKSIASKMTLHLWTGDEIDNLLVGQAIALRGTYFGELVLTPEILRERHEQSVARIRARWQADVHHVLDAERALRRMLGESDSWDALRAQAAELRSQMQAIESAPAVPVPLAPVVASVVEMGRQSSDALDRVAGGICDGDLDMLRDEISSRPRTLCPDVTTAPRRLRSGNHLASLYVTNAVGGCREALRLLADAEAAFSSRVVAVLAPAGCGKTQLAAQLTAGTDARPHGVLLHGRDLHANHTLDNLARRVSIAAHPVPSMESLLAAVDAAGQRARHRLPVVIDGLNESEDPREWKPLLAEVESTLAKYPYVLLVCTLRPEFAAEALPPNTRYVEIEGYGAETIEAIRAHFRFYKIEATDAPIPLELLKHPLTLRLFCEVTNPTRVKVVGVDAMPGSLTALFDRYLDQVGNRIAELAPRTQRYYAQDVRAALGLVASTLWDNRTRFLEIDELRRALGDEGRPWDQSIVRALEHEGVLLRMPSDGTGAYAPAYDPLGGHIIASALLSRHGQAGLESWIRDASTTTLLGGDFDQRHPLADDVVYSLVGQLPRRLHAKQLWQLVEEPLRARALRFAAGLEAAYLDAATVEALLDLVRQGDSELLQKLRQVRGAVSHPLNAEALDRVLRPLDVADRDLSWTEWLRRHQEKPLSDLERLEQRWRGGGARIGDRLRARWIMWTLTSTVRRLRDQATRALYWLGRTDPEGLFELTIDSLTVNDAYVSERMLAASYGVVMSHQRADADLGVCLKPFLNQLMRALVGPTATAPTTHYLARLYVRGIVAFATKFYDAVVPDSLRGRWSFAAPSPVPPISTGDARAEEVGRTLHMDFENYTLGRLFDDRGNYDMDHQGHQAAAAHICGVVWSLGWRAAAFDPLDRAIADDAFRAEGRGHRPRAERYGKKYGWIGFFTYAGVLEAQGLLPDDGRRLSDVDIDPSFPEPPPVDGEPTASQAWLKPSVESHERWACGRSTEVPPRLVVREKIGEHQGPWVAVHGFVKASDRVLGREAWAFLSALVTRKQGVSALVAALNAGERPWVARDAPSDHYTFAGEIPWHPSFAAEALAESDFERVYRESVRVSTSDVEVEALAHRYAWESYHSEMNHAGSARVPSRCFSSRFDLRSAPQGFDQFLPDGTRATITLRGVDGLEGDILYIREDLLRQYVSDRTIVWFAFGERELRPYPRSPPEWLMGAQRQQSNAWRVVITEADLEPRRKKARTKKKVTRNQADTRKKATNRKVATDASMKKPAARRKS
ncbi:NACHT domain-containing protein [Sorangium sp. So ce394]|uniref:NACHT domain-containing protein n=1 Tax=Sorangium sp. So ce394 TaxID=3133310 RepID=UPI003F5C7E32